MRPQLARTVFALLLGVSLAMFLTPGDDVPPDGPNDKVVCSVDTDCDADEVCVEGLCQ